MSDNVLDQNKVIIFDSPNKAIIRNAVSKPDIYISKLEFHTSDDSWVQRLQNAVLNIDVKGLKNDTLMVAYQNPLVLSSYITPDSILPKLTINHWFKYLNNQKPDEDCNKWVITYRIEGLEYQDNESVALKVIDYQYIYERIENWIENVTNLYSNVKDWIIDKPEFHAKIGKQPAFISEEFMNSFSGVPYKIDTLDIFKNKDLFLSFKPIGIWMIGANGRIDLISSIGNFIIVNKSETFAPPQWMIYSSTNRSKGVDLTKDEFLKLLR